MKTIYFVRHGESEGNEIRLVQGPDSMITERGRGQAMIIAERCAKLPIEVIISSTMIRAIETAKIIADKINKPIESSDLFRERRRIKEQIGKNMNDPEVIKTQKLLADNFYIDNSRLADEENFNDLKTRAGNVLEFLENRKENNILVVTHGLFLGIIIARVIFGEKLTGHECLRFIEKTIMKNTGITVITNDSTEHSEDEPWRLVVWNDHAHLG